MKYRMHQKVAERKAYALKYVSLITLTLQNAVLGLSMRYSRTRQGDLFFSSTAVFMAEIVKLVTCLGIVYIDVGGIVKLSEALNNAIIKQPLDTLKVGVPAILYVIQNTLLYLSASNLDAATYQVTYQLKIFTTAIFTVLILKRQLIPTQWLSLVSLIGGVALVQLAKGEQSSKVPNGTEQNQLVGFLAALGACCLSGFAGVYFEKILKGSDVSVWMRNIQLSLLSIPIGLVSCVVQDWSKLVDKGFFFGYDGFVVYLIILQATGGLLVALVVKYADNILKGFATSLAIIITCVASIFIFNFKFTIQFGVGAGFVIFAIFLYGYQPKKKTVPPPAHKV